MLEEGISYSKKTVVTENMSAISMHSGGLHVFATPMMIALMEEACLECVQPHLDSDCGTVGTLVNIEHVAPTPVGMTVTVNAHLTQIDGRRLVFDVEAHDERELIGKGTHERFIIKNEKFQSKCDAKNG